MDLINYDFESALESGFVKLFEGSTVDLRIADDIDEGKIPDECVMLELDVGGAVGDQHQNVSGNYNQYSGTLQLTVRTPRVSGDQVAVTAGFKSRHTELVARSRKLLEEIDSADLTANWLGDAYLVSGAGVANLNGTYNRNGTEGGKNRYTFFDVDGVTIIGEIVAVSSSTWALNNENGSRKYAKIGESASTLTPPSSGWVIALGGTAPAPTLSVLQNPISPTRIIPTNTERENDERHRTTTLSYNIQFTIT